METSTLHPGLSARYLRILAVQIKDPTLDKLCELVQAQLTRIPFENISKLYYRKHRELKELPGLDLYLDGIENYHFGGTCYANNYYFYLLLLSLGYQARLCGADMSNPDVHLVIMVAVEGREYLIDAGYAAPFLSPMPRDLAMDHIIALGRDIYVLKPQDRRGRSRILLIREGQHKHGYVAKPEPRQITEFEGVIADSYREEATFMNSLLLVRFAHGRSTVLHNLTLIETEGSSFRVKTLADRDELAQAVLHHFSIPRKIT